MSFGYGIGDFITVIALANKIRKDFSGAPSQFKSINDEVRAFSIILQDADVNSSEYTPNEQQKKDLQEIIDNCHNVLVDLEKILGKYVELKTSGENFSMKAKRVWKRLKWEPEDIRELRQRLTSNGTLISTYIGQLSSQTALSTKKGVDHLTRQQDEQERLVILDWLTPIDYAPQQSDFINRRQAGTGQWFLDSPQFKTWVQVQKQTLFCPGMPGAGKTLLASIVIDEITSRFGNDETTGIAYIYCNFRKNHEQRAEDLLVSLVKQMAQGRPSLPESVRTIYDKHKEKRTRPSLDEISKALQSMAAVYSRVFIIIDALDECQTIDGCRETLLEDMFNLTAKCGANFIATSRDIPNITEKFKGFPSLEIRASPEDVQRYVDGHISHLGSFIARKPELKEEIVTKIVTTVDGMFLLAQLHLDSLKDKTTPKAIRLALEKLPSGSDEAYDLAYQKAMERIEGQLEGHVKLAKQVLSWITHAKRPLTVTELRHALGVEVGEVELDEDNLPEVEDMVSVCAGLVTVDEESSIIRLVHYTTQEYFERTQQKWLPNAESEITRICAIYMSFTTFGSGRCENNDDFKERLHSNPFYDYAVQNWGHHARTAEILYQEVINFLQDHGAVEASSQALMAVKEWPYLSQITPRRIIGLHLAAYSGVDQALKVLIQDSLNTNAQDDNGQTPLLYAAKNGHEAVVKLLLAKEGVDPDSRDNYNRTPLLYAVDNGHEAVIKLLLEQGVDPDSRDKYNRMPLSYAASNGHEAVVKLLLAKGVDPDSRDKINRTPLLYAAWNGYETIVKLLLEQGADPDSRDKDNRTPLSYTAWNSKEAIVKLLLAKGADPDSRDKDNWTPLLYAALNGKEAIVKLLLAKGADPDSRDKDNRTPLSYAAEEGKEAIVKLLLEQGADPDSRDNYNQTPLLYAAERGKEAIVKLLLEQGADPDSRDRWNRTPLSYAAERGEEAIVKLLLAKGVDPDSRDKNNRTPLSYTAERGKEAIVKLLLEQGSRVDPDLRDTDNRTPLSYAVDNGHEAVVKLLNVRKARGV